MIEENLNEAVKTQNNRELAGQVDPLVMQNFVFVYVLNNTFRCLDINGARTTGKDLVKEGWKHTATINPETWIEFFLNGGESTRREAIECISA